MVARTHDLAAFTTLSIVAAYTPLPQMTMATMLVSLAANFIGGLAPDLDQPTSDLWRRIPAGSIWGRILSPLFGGHRMIAHSIVGIVIIGIGMQWLLSSIAHILVVDMNVVWWAFMIGLVSHIFMDTFTKEGVPLLFPLPWNFGFPPVKALRVKAGGMFEKSVIFPGLMLFTGFIYYINYPKFLDLFRNLIT
ncbi:metal-dependent hydrolase [candidate division WWE3 bacterium]|nr:metal-dependent hydrolase [candidate division WWE3 bacterium]